MYIQTGDNDRVERERGKDDDGDDLLGSKEKFENELGSPNVEMVGYFVSRSQLHYTSSLSDPPAATYSSRSSIQMPISHTFSRFSSSSRASNLFQRENKRKKDEPWQISSCRRCRSRMNGCWRRSEFHYCWPLFYPIMMAKLGTSLKREGQHKSHLPKTKNNMVGGEQLPPRLQK